MSSPPKSRWSSYTSRQPSLRETLTTTRPSPALALPESFLHISQIRQARRATHHSGVSSALTTPTYYSSPSFYTFTTSSSAKKNNRKCCTFNAQFRILRYLCLVLHVVLVLGYIALLMVWTRHLDLVTFKLGKESNRADIEIKFLLQAIVVIYSALLVSTTFWVDRLNPAPITHITRSNFKLRRYIHRISLLLYLIGLSIINISAPALVNIQIYNATSTSEMTLSGLPDYTDAKFANHTSRLTVQEWLPMVSQLPPQSTIGVQGGTMYPVPSSTTTTTTTKNSKRIFGSLPVSATFFNVSCGLVPDTAAALSSLAQFSAASGCAKDPRYSVCFPPAQGVLLFANSTPNSDDHQLLLGVSTIIFPDSGSELGSILSLNPSINYTTPTGTVNITKLQFMQCSLTLNQFNTTVDLSTRMLHSPISGSGTTTWQNVTDQADNNSGLQPYEAALINQWTDMVAGSRNSGSPTIQNCTNSCLQFSFSEISLMQTLGITTPYVQDFVQPAAQTLSDLQIALSNMTALLFWTDLNLSPPTSSIIGANTTTTTTTTSLLQPSPILSNVVVELSTLSSHISLSLLSIILGLGSSIQMLMTCIAACIPMVRSRIGSI